MIIISGMIRKVVGGFGNILGDRGMVVTLTVDDGIQPRISCFWWWLRKTKPYASIVDVLSCTYFSIYQFTIIGLILHTPHPVSWTSLMSTIRELLLSAKHLPSDVLPLIAFQKRIDNLEELAVTWLRSEVSVNPTHWSCTQAKDIDSMSETQSHSKLLFSIQPINSMHQQKHDRSRSMRELVPLGCYNAKRWVDYLGCKGTCKYPCSSLY